MFRGNRALFLFTILFLYILGSICGTQTLAAPPLQLELKKSYVRFVLGSNTPKLVSGLSTVPLGGVSLADQVDVGHVYTGPIRWRYGASLGMVDKNTKLADLQYGTGAARAWVDVRLSARLSVDGLYQRALHYEQLGIGGRYDFDRLGVWAINLTQSQHQAQQGWRYQGRYEVGLSPTINVAVSAATFTGQFSNLLQAQNHSRTTAQSKHGMDVQWDAGRWGKFGANYASALPRLGQKEHEFGISQQFWYSPNLRIDIDAQRQTHSGDYNVGLRFSLPVF